MPAKGVFPTRENCDPTNPEEAFLYMFAALPGVNGGQFIMPIEYFRVVSKRLWDLGARPVAEPVLEYVPPSANDPNWATSAGRWVPVGSVTQQEKDRRLAASELAKMGHQQRVELYKALKARQAGEPLPETKAAGIVQTLSDGQCALLLELLSDAT